ncbi:HNH endonuclease [Escherichia coli]|nr:HNH endonuclease [Escherichia coli]
MGRSGPHSSCQPERPKGNTGHSEEEAQTRTNDSENLMLLCPECHNRIDRDGR